MNVHDFVLGYLFIGFVWIAGGILTGYIKLVRANDPLFDLVTLALAWPYVAYRIIRNILTGNPNGEFWP